jgi:hypothetical protein
VDIMAAVVILGVRAAIMGSARRPHAEIRANFPMSHFARISA